MDEALGTRSGYIKGLGYRPKPTTKISNARVVELEASLKKTQDELQQYKANFGLFQTQIEAMTNALIVVRIQVSIPQFSGIHFSMLTICIVKVCQHKKLKNKTLRTILFKKKHSFVLYE